MRLRSTLGATAAATLLLTGCGGGGGEPAPAATTATNAPESAPSASAAASSSSSTTPPAALPASTVTGTPGAPQDVVTGLGVPWGITPLPDGSVLVPLRDEARIVRVRDGRVVPLTTTGPDGTVPGVDPAGEGGLLGLAVSPSDPSVLFAYTTAADDNRVVRMRLDGDALGEPQPVLTGIPKADIHNGGRIAFGPDGLLYVGTGEAGDQPIAQDVAGLGGKILRITPDGQPAPGNPDPASPVWTSGHRNVQGLGWDAAGRMYAAEFGQNTFDELNLIEGGRNYGWPEVEGTASTDEQRSRFTDPLVTWPTEESSPSGILVTGDAVYLAALAGERLWRVPLADGQIGTPEPLLAGELGRLRDVALGPDGALWVATSNTFRGDPRDGDDRIVRLPLS